MVECMTYVVLLICHAQVIRGDRLSAFIRVTSQNGMEFRNTLMDQVLKELGIERIFSAPYHLQSNGKLDIFHKYLKPTLKKLCEKNLSNWDKYINQVLAIYRVTPNLATAETPFFLVYGRDPNLALHQLLEPIQ